MTDVVLALPFQDSPENGAYSGPLAYGREWFNRVLDELEDRNISYTVIEGDDVTREKFEETVERENPILVYQFGHGFASLITGDYSERQDDYPIILAVPGRVEYYGYTVSLDNVDRLQGTVSYTFACNCAKELLPEAIDEGALATAGYDDEYIWTINPDVPPERDSRAEPFGIAGTEFAIALLQGNSVREARNRTIQKFNELIVEYEQGASVYSREIVKWLIWDRDHFKSFGNLEETPLKGMEVVREAIVPPELVAVVVGGSLLGLAYQDMKRGRG